MYTQTHIHTQTYRNGVLEEVSMKSHVKLLEEVQAPRLVSEHFWTRWNISQCFDDKMPGTKNFMKKRG